MNVRTEYVNGLFIFFFLLYCGLVAEAQTQQGVVRTAQRPDREKVYLEDVEIRLRDSIAPIFSDDEGKFEIEMPQNMNAGDAFYVSSVKKDGYILADSRVLEKAFTYAPDKRIEFIMLDSKAKEEDINKLSVMIRKRMAETFSHRMSELESLLAENHIAEDMYRTRLQTLQNWRDKFESQIGYMAEWYASTDYAAIDTLNGMINLSIERGNLARADSLLSLAGSLQNLFDENMKLESEARKCNTGGGAGTGLNDSCDMTAIHEEKARIGELLYNRFYVFLSDAEPDSAAFYIKMRALLDTANVGWQLSAGSFMSNYFPDNDDAMAFYQRALRHALSMYGEISSDVATCYNNIGYRLKFNYYLKFRGNSYE